MSEEQPPTQPAPPEGASAPAAPVAPPVGVGAPAPGAPVAPVPASPPTSPAPAPVPGGAPIPAAPPSGGASSPAGGLPAASAAISTPTDSGDFRSVIACTETKPLTGGILSAPPAAVIPSDAPGGVPVPVALPTDGASSPAPIVPAPVGGLPVPASEAPAPAAEDSGDTYFYVMKTADGQAIEFPIESAGTTVELDTGPITLQPSGKAVENATHKYIAFDSGETELYDSVKDPDGMTNIVSDPANEAHVLTMSVKMANFPVASAPTPPEPTARP